MASLLAPAPGSTVPGTEIAVVERREAFPWPLFSGDPGIMLRHHYQGASFGAPPPSFLFEGGSLDPPLTRRDLRAAMTLARRKEQMKFSPSSPRKREPIIPGGLCLAVSFNKVTRTFRNHQRHGVWVPAFAGTTRGEMVASPYSPTCIPSPDAVLLWP